MGKEKKKKSWKKEGEYDCLLSHGLIQLKVVRKKSVWDGLEEGIGGRWWAETAIRKSHRQTSEIEWKSRGSEGDEVGVQENIQILFTCQIGKPATDVQLTANYYYCTITVYCHS